MVGGRPHRNLQARRRKKTIQGQALTLSTSDVPGPAQSRKPGQAGPYLGRAKPSPRCWPSKGFGPAHDSSKPEPAAQAAALVLYYITTIYIYMLNKNETFVMNG